MRKQDNSCERLKSGSDTVDTPAYRMHNDMGYMSTTNIRIVGQTLRPTLQSEAGPKLECTKRCRALLLVE